MIREEVDFYLTHEHVGLLSGEDGFNPAEDQLSVFWSQACNLTQWRRGWSSLCNGIRLALERRCDG